MFVHCDTKGGGGRFLWSVVWLFLFGAACGSGLTVFFYESGRRPAPTVASAPAAAHTPAAEAPPVLGRWEDEPVPVTLEDLVEFVFLTPQGSPASLEFRLLVEPLFTRAQEENPPDFIRVHRERFGKVVQGLPPDATAARDVLSKILARSPSIPPCPAVPEREWEEKVHALLWRVPGELSFLRRLPTWRGEVQEFSAGTTGRTFKGVSPLGQGNAAAISTALSFIRGDRQRIRNLWTPPPPPPGPGP
jgi:hypothetical protein